MVEKEQHKASARRQIRKQSLLSFALALAAIVLLNIIASFYFVRLDLTAEKRHTLSTVTRDMLRGLDDVVYFRVYLEGEFPSGFKRLSRSTQETLDEFRAWSDKIEYEFINPSASEDPKVRNDIYRQLAEKGLEPTSLQVRQKDGSEQKVIFPGALLSYKGREIPLQLLQSQTGKAPEQVLNSSIQDLEYNLASGIRKLVSSQRQRVAVLDAYGTPSDLLLWDALSALNEFYQVERINLNEKLSSLTERTFNEDSTRILFKNKYDAVLIIKPSQAFSERDKFILDQYLMRGGKLLWALDRTNADMDSLRASPETVGIARDLNLEDMLFRYGARINPDLLMDIRSMPIPVRTGEMGGQPQFEFYPWYYMPLLSASGNHPVVNNLNMIHSAFVSSVDSIEVAGIRKTALLLTSQYTRKVATPAYISLEILRSEPDQRMFADGVHTAALLLEGRFPSLFANRIPPEILESKEMGFLEESEPSRMIVIGDGDLFLNQISAGTRNPLPLGYDQYTGESFGNRDFLVNAVNYLTDESGLIQIRSREIRLRMLDRTRVAAEKPRWQLLNTAGPVLLVLLLSAAGAFLRKRRYGTKS